MHEVNIIKGLSHPNIIEYRGSFTGLDFGVKPLITLKLTSDSSVERRILKDQKQLEESKSNDSLFT